MSIPEDRFEVPPEYAEVYERAYRRAYEEGQGQLSGGPEMPARRPRLRRRKFAVPEQRGSKVVPPERGPRPGQHSGPAERSARNPTSRDIPPADAKATGNAGHRAVPRAGSTLYPFLGLLGLIGLLMLAAFVVGRLTGGTVDKTDLPRGGTQPGASSSATQGPPSPSASPSPTKSATPKVYRGPVAPLNIGKARAACTASPGRDARDRRVSYAARNVLDGGHRTAWRCNGKAIGRTLVLTLPRRSLVAWVALVPGYAKTDPATGRDRYAENNRITRVAWIFDDGTRVVQTMSGRKGDRSLRSMRIVPVKTRTVTLKILAVATGPKITTMISTVRLAEPAPRSD